MRSAIGTPVPVVEKADRDATESTLRRHLAAPAFGRASEQGAGLTLEEAADVAAAHFSPAPSGAFTPP